MQTRTHFHSEDERRREQQRLSYAVNEALRLLGIGRNTFYKEVADCRLATFKVRGRRLVSHRALVDYIRAREAESGGGG